MSEIKSAEYWAHKGKVKLYVYRKRAASTGKGTPVLFLVHGSSASGRNSFDLSVPGRSDY
ncbi:MAG: Alpha/beta hydrolase family protein, partial [Proteobacteria bacterium]|nr:Alpha/beta hydrolase family protein [Pseudomonadota bacterium]